MGSQDRTRKMPLSPRPPPARVAPEASAELRGRERLGQGPSVLPPRQLGTLGISFHPHLLPFPMVCLRPQPTTSPRLEGLALGCPQEESLFRRPWGARVILTKKSKLKRKRKYLVTLMQADPIPSVLELPGDRREGRLVSAGQGLGWGRRGNRR